MTAQKDREQSVVVSPLGLEGRLGLPGISPKRLVVFADGSGSSRLPTTPSALKPRRTDPYSATRKMPAPGE